MITLTGIRQGYEGTFPATAETLADRPTRHLLVFLLHPDCAEIRVIDREAENYINIRSILASNS